ncbi:MAG: hypothetical protein ACFCGT_17100 [Sandaracinaceae bacterium]
MGPRRPRIAAAALVVALLPAASAAGQGGSVASIDDRPASLELLWDAPAGCPGRSVLLARVDQLSGGLLFTSPIRVRLEARVVPAGRAFELLLISERDGSVGRRAQRAPECETLADLVVLIAALLLDPHLPARDALAAAGRTATQVTATSDGASSASGEAAEEAIRGEGAEDGLAPSSTRAVPPDEDREAGDPADAGEPGRFQGLIGAAIEGEVAILPAVSFGISGTVGMRIRDLVELRLAPYALLPRSSRLQPGGDPGARIARFGVIAEGCWVLRPLERLETSPCVGVDASAMTGRSFGVDAPSRGWTASFAASLGGRVALQLVGALRFSVAMRLLVPVARPAFAIEGLGRVHRISPIGGRIALEADVLRF